MAANNGGLLPEYTKVVGRSRVGNSETDAILPEVIEQANMRTIKICQLVRERQTANALSRNRSAGI